MRGHKSIFTILSGYVGTDRPTREPENLRIPQIGLEKSWFKGSICDHISHAVHLFFSLKYSLREIL